MFSDTSRKVRSSLPIRLILGLAILLAPVLPLSPFFDNGQAQQAYAGGNGLSVYVGYPGGPYYEKKHYTHAELQAMSSSTLYEYATLDARPALRKGFAKGVLLATVFTKAGVAPTAVRRFYFATSDMYISDDGADGTTAQPWYYNELFGQRYYYPDYPNYYNFATGAITDAGRSALLATARSVPTVLALESAFNRVESSTDALWNAQTLTTDNAYRIMYGQLEPLTRDAHYSAHDIAAITCILGGNNNESPRPEIVLDISSLNGKVGDSFTFMPRLEALDSLVSQEGVKDIQWTSANTKVATVVRNSDGSITVKLVGAGDVVIEGKYGNSTSSKYVASWNGAGYSTGGGSGAGTGGSSGSSSGGSKGTGQFSAMMEVFAQNAFTANKQGTRAEANMNTVFLDGVSALRLILAGNTALEQGDSDEEGEAGGEANDAVAEMSNSLLVTVDEASKGLLYTLLVVSLLVGGAAWQAINYSRSQDKSSVKLRKQVT